MGPADRIMVEMLTKVGVTGAIKVAELQAAHWTELTQSGMPVEAAAKITETTTTAILDLIADVALSEQLVDRIIGLMRGEQS